MNQQSEAFARYQENLAAGRNFSEAWQEAFPRLSGEALDRAVNEYVWAGDYSVFELNAAPPSAPVVARTLERSEEHALQALLWQSCYKCPDSVRERWKQDVKLALAANSNQVQASAMAIVMEAFDPQESFTRSKALVAAHPESWLSWVTLGVAAARVGKLPEVVANPRLDPGHHAFLLAPKQPYAVLTLAMSHAGALAKADLSLPTLSAGRLFGARFHEKLVCLLLPLRHAPDDLQRQSRRRERPRRGAHRRGVERATRRTEFAPARDRARGGSTVGGSYRPGG
jgi:hypothetical protein